MAQIKPSLELYHWSKDEPHSFNHLDFTGFWKKPKNGPKMVRKRFFGIISGTKSPRTKIFALFGSSHMTGPGPSIKIFGVLGEYVELLNQLILTGSTPPLKSGILVWKSISRSILAIFRDLLHHNLAWRSGVKIQLWSPPEFSSFQTKYLPGPFSTT